MLTNTRPISGVVISFNEEDNIARCLLSLKKVCEEIIVVDSFSTDKTLQIAKSLGATTVQHPFAGHIEQKNFAINQSAHEWVLSLDADEELDHQLVAEILRFKNNHSTQEAYIFKRKTQYVDQWIKYCGWYPDPKVRLFKKSVGSWGGNNPHDIVVLKEGIRPSFLGGEILHYSYNSISDHIHQTNRFTTIAAHAAYRRGKRSHYLFAVVRAFFKFGRDYLWKQGFRDGRYGLIICLINSLSVFLKYVKIQELSKNKKID